MGDPLPLSPDEIAARTEAHRAARLALPALTVQEWAELHGIGRSTALKWAIAGELDAWRSGAAWLIRPNAPRPVTRPVGRPPREG